MSDQARSKLDTISERIQQLKDELEVQLHLGAAEARDEWAKVEGQLEQFKEQSEQVAEVAEDAVEGVLEAASLAGEEIVKGYERIKEMLSK